MSGWKSSTWIHEYGYTYEQKWPYLKWDLWKAIASFILFFTEEMTNVCSLKSCDYSASKKCDWWLTKVGTCTTCVASAVLGKVHPNFDKIINLFYSSQLPTNSADTEFLYKTTKTTEICIPDFQLCPMYTHR